MGFWPPWYSTTNNIVNFDPRFYDPATEAIIDPTTGRRIGGDRFNGLVLPGDGFEGEGKISSSRRIRRCRHSSVESPAGSAKTHYNAIQPRLGVLYALNEKTVVRASAGVFHNRVTLNDSTPLEETLRSSRW